jgi:hypothetical protein
MIFYRGLSMHVFVSFSKDGKCIGCCTVELPEENQDDPRQVMSVAAELGLVPEGCSKIHAVVVSGPVHGMEVGKFYSLEEAVSLGVNLVRN